jgi:hypothetical protein
MNITNIATTKANLDELAYEYYGNTYDYNCAANCGSSPASGTSVAGFLNDSNGAGFPSVKAINITAPNTGGSSSSQAASTVLGTTTSSVSGSVTSIPVSAITAAGSASAGTLPAGLFIIANTSLPPTSWQFLETSGVTGCTSGCSIPVTGSCTTTGWELNVNTCTNSTGTMLNTTYATGSDIYLDAIGYAHGTLHAGGWDCGANAAYAAAHNMLGVSEWFAAGAANTNLCFDTIQPFVSGQ